MSSVICHQYRRIGQTPAFSLLLTAAFLVVGGTGAFHHEMWRDEIQAWLLARDSTGPIDLLRNMKYEGHPPLWHLLLMPITRLTHAPATMQVMHLLIAATTVFLFAEYSPFTTLQKLLFPFGYFVIYEYGIVCRNYGLGVLLLCIACILFRTRYQRFILLSISLFLTGHTSVHALIITICITIGLGFEYIFTQKTLIDRGNTSSRTIWIGFGIMWAGILTAVWQLNPPPDCGTAAGWKTDCDLPHLAKVINTITEVHFPIPQDQIHFWGSCWIEQFSIIQHWSVVISISIFIWTITVLLRTPTALFIYTSATLGLLLFFYTKYFGSIRHHGFVFITVVTAIWISNDCETTLLGKPLNSLYNWSKKSLRPILTLILVAHAFGGIRAVRLDKEHVFSHGKQTAQYIDGRNMNDMPIIGDADVAVSAVVGYLKNPRQVHYMRGDRPGSFIRFDNKRTKECSDEQIIYRAKEINSDKVLIILNRGLDKVLLERNRIEIVAQFTGSIVGSEDFYLYLLERFP